MREGWRSKGGEGSSEVRLVLRGGIVKGHEWTSSMNGVHDIYGGWRVAGSCILCCILRR